MTKLNKNTFTNIEFWEIKTLLDENKDFYDLKDFIREMTLHILEESNRETIDDIEFNNINKHIEFLNNCKNILKLQFPWKKFGIKFISFLAEWQTIDDFRNYIFSNEEIRDLLGYWKTENLELFFSKNWIIKNKKELEKLLNNYDNLDKIIYLLEYWKLENIKLFLEKYNIKDINDLYKYIDIWILGYFWLNNDKFKIVLNSFKNWFSKNNIWENYYLLFPVKSKQSKVLDELNQKMDIYPDRDIHDIMREEVCEFLSWKKIEKQKYWELELAIYLRYSHTVDYPEIWELIIIFMQEAIKSWIIKWVNWIKILPRRKYILPRKNILDENSRFCNLEWEEFSKELNTNSIPIYLSYSSNQSNWFAITSSSMNRKKWQVDLWLELEENYNKNRTHEKTIREIFDKLIYVIWKINNRKT